MKEKIPMSVATEDVANTPQSNTTYWKTSQILSSGTKG